LRHLAFIAFVAALVACATPREEPIVHLEERGKTETIPLSASQLDARLVDAARDYEEYAPAPRIALFDLSLPADQQEYDALCGFAVIVVTALVQDSTELPPSRVFVKRDGKEFELIQLVSRQGTQTGSAVITRVFGDYRFDGLYLFPMEFRARGAQVILDFARNRSDFVLSTFPMQPEPDGFPISAPTAGSPDPETLARFVAREIPIFATFGNER